MPCAKPNRLWSDEHARERDNICVRYQKKGQKRKISKKWLTDASTNMNVKPLSLGTGRKETDTPVLIFWLKKINYQPHSIEKASVNKI